MEPSEKSPGMTRALDELTKATYGRSRSEAIGSSVCVECPEHIKGFRDKLSLKEYRISGLCQNCQDKVFGQEPERDEFPGDLAY